MSRSPAGLAMATAAVMLAHQVAGKAFRDAAFLSAWPATALPSIIAATAALIMALVPVFGWLLARYTPRVVVTTGFALSAFAHLAEWLLYDEGGWIAVVIYLHLAGVAGFLLSGFWSLIAERFDPAGAKAVFGRIAAAGTAGGAFGSLIADRVASEGSFAAVLLLLMALHLLCAGGLLLMRSAPSLLPQRNPGEVMASALQTLVRTPYVRTIAGTVLLTTAGAAILDYLLKSEATAALGTGADLLRFFAVFYAFVQVLSFLLQTASTPLIRSLGIGGSIAALPLGVGAAGLVAAVFSPWPAIVGLRGVEAIVRGSLFRSGYELLFVPMDADERRRIKAGLDLTCDRIGEAAGAGIVQLMLVFGAGSQSGGLLTVVLVLAAAALLLGRRLDRLYLGVVEQQLLKYRDDVPMVSVVSEAGWTIVQLPQTPAAGEAALPRSAAAPAAPRMHAPAPPVPAIDPAVTLLGELRSGDAARVAAALARPAALSRLHVVQLVDLLAWDEVLPAVRAALEPIAPAHVGMLVDALLARETDFAIRRRLPRILGTVATQRSLDGLVSGLDDIRFEVRYHCSRAIDRILTRNPELTVDRGRMIAVVERELSVPPQVWQGHRLLDRVDWDDAAAADEPVEISARNLEHVVSLLSTIVARDPLDAAVRGIRSPYAGVRGLAVEYFDQVLPPAVLERLRALMTAATPSSGDAPSRSGAPPTAR